LLCNVRPNSTQRRRERRDTENTFHRSNGFSRVQVNCATTLNNCDCGESLVVGQSQLSVRCPLVALPIFTTQALLSERVRPRALSRRTFNGRNPWSIDI